MCTDTHINDTVVDMSMSLITDWISRVANLPKLEHTTQSCSGIVNKYRKMSKRNKNIDNVKD